MDISAHPASCLLALALGIMQNGASGPYHEDISRGTAPDTIEAFNGRLRQECLNESWFLSLEDAREKVEAWRLDYNRQRPHGALGNLAPLEYAQSVK